ncbi:HSF-type DNA-binding protein [Nitzschia inconspicua]|uniref:HSF-type DNA-binding protein n=1 Tax=Nitzschia inconspicua TaxID=303405 RepID=A0A9K3PR73_9STRA|nr:HSF-type DNA-binding protein [Nitzschia inconspicua]
MTTANSVSCTTESLAMETHLSVTDIANGAEKTIPFLSRLVDMLSENDGVISFVPGSIKKRTLGKIVVHDRIKVEADVLPKYFNHSSFASLRRQLNYFSFARQGKGRQKCATYSNDQVVELEDILRLRRRPAPATSGGETPTPTALATMDEGSDGDGLQTPSSSVASKKRSRNNNDTSCPSSSNTTAKKSRLALTITPPKTVSSTTPAAVVSPNLISPRSSPSQSARPSPEGMRIALDLTVPPPPDFCGGTGNVIRSISDSSMESLTVKVEEDIMTGSQALLSLKHARTMAAMAW